MSKKVFTLATTRCGYCKMTEQFVQSRFPDIGDKYIYFNYDQEKMTPESELVLRYAKATRVTGVPFTVMIDKGDITRALRGYDPKGITSFLEEVLSEPKSGQLEIPFED